MAKKRERNNHKPGSNNNNMIVVQILSCKGVAASVSTQLNINFETTWGWPVEVDVVNPACPAFVMPISNDEHRSVLPRNPHWSQPFIELVLEIQVLCQLLGL